MPNASVIERESKEKPDRQDIHLQEDEIGSEQSVRVRRKASTLMQQLHEERNFEKQPADSPISTPRSNPQTPRATPIRGAGGLADRFAAGLGEGGGMQNEKPEAPKQTVCWVERIL